MRRFVYSPDVHAYIATENHGVIDVSADIISGTVSRRLDAVSDASLTIQNPNRKYLRRPTNNSRTNWVPLFKPMDRIVIYLTRIHQPMQVLAGYLDDVPYDQLYPGPVTLNASCTLKRLLYTYWDPGLQYAQGMLRKYGWELDLTTGNISANGTVTGATDLADMDVQGGLGMLLREVLSEVGNWPIGTQQGERNTVHVLHLPDTWITKAEEIATQQQSTNKAQKELIRNLIRAIVTPEGSISGPPFAVPGGNDPQTFSSNYQDSDPLPSSLAGSYTAKVYGPTISVGNPPPGMTSAERSNRIKYGPKAALIANSMSPKIPVEIFFGLIRAESAWGTIQGGMINGPGNHTGGSDPGAVGLTQLYFPTWTSTKPGPGGTSYTPDQVIGRSPDLQAGNPDLQLLLGAYELSNRYKETGDWTSALNGYNGDASSSNPYAGVVLEYAAEERKAFASSRDDINDLGKVGDVKVPNKNWFVKDALHLTPDQGATFRIKGNPYGDDSMIFRSVKVDSSLKSNEISIFLPGADGTTEQGELWRKKSNHTVVVETSYGKTPFRRSSKVTKATGSKSRANPNNMSISQLVGPGGRGSEYSGMMPITKAGLAFIQDKFGPFIMIAGKEARSGASSQGDHPKGLAVDLVPCDKAGNTWTAEGIARCDALAQWAGWQNPGHYVNVYGDQGGEIQGDTSGNPVTRWVGWRWDALHGPPTGLGACQGPTPHIHVSFVDVDPAKIPGIDKNSNPIPTIAPSNQAVNSAINPTGVPAQTISEMGNVALSTIMFTQIALPVDSIMSQSLRGELALANDVPLKDWIDTICKASGRSYQSMPNGDFLAFYPNYFNWAKGDSTYSQPYLDISDIEIIDLNITLSDKPLATHVFTVGDTYWGNESAINADLLGAAVASIESIKNLSDFVNLDPNFDPVAFMSRYGARPATFNEPNIKNQVIQFLYGWKHFMEKWAEQFNCQVEFTFLPELWPGTLVNFRDHDLQMFVQDVTHNFDRSSGFTTTATLTAPSSLGGFNYGMALASPHAATGNKDTKSETANPSAQNLRNS
jgi:hypothetical protein